MKTAAVVLAEGSEEMETVIAVDVLRRAGIATDVIGLEPGLVKCSRDVCVQPDMAWEQADFDRYDMLVLPGGKAGMERMRADERVIEVLGSFAAQGRLIGAICAAPLLLDAAGLIERTRVTCHPGVADQLRSGERVDERVVVSGRIVSSQGPGTAMEFALQLVEMLLGMEAREQVDSGLCRL